MPEVRIDESVSPAAHRAGMLAALRDGVIDNRFHYVGEESAALWRALAASHSPAHADDGLAAYDAATRTVVEVLPRGPAHVIGVACGDGVKERRLLGALAGAGRDGLSATPVDVSVPLVTAAADAMGTVPGVDATHAVAVDITAVTDLSPLLAPRLPGTRVVTLFGVISTLGPGAVAPALSLLEPGDILMVSANLLPEATGARARVMQQYDNAPTRQWLGAVLADIGLHDAGGVEFRWAKGPRGSDLILGEVIPPDARMAEVAGVVIDLPAGRPLTVLRSYRHTEPALGELLDDAGLEVLCMAISPSGEEGVAVARA